MQKHLVNAVIFSVGVAVGAASTFFLVKKKYETIAQDEIRAVKDRFNDAMKDLEKITDEEKEIRDKMKEEPDRNEDEDLKGQVTMEDYAKELRNQGHVNYSDVDDSEVNHFDEDISRVWKGVDPDGEDWTPYVISPEEYASDNEYETISLYVFADGVITDEDYNLIADWEEKVGDGAAHFGEYEDDVVYVRNERLKCNYELLRDNRSYRTDIYNSIPHSKRVDV